MKQAVIITENQYPCEDAGAIRQHATAKILEALGYHVMVVGYGKSTNMRILNYDGIDYISCRTKSQNKYVRAFYRATFSDRMMRFFKKKCRNASLILVADVFPPSIKKIARYAKNKDITLVHDSVEWFSPEQFKDGENSKTYKMRDEINTKLMDQNWRIMAISSYLEEHFANRCEKAIRVPVIMDIHSIECNLAQKDVGQKIRFAYVGSPGKKDYLKNIIEGFALLLDEQKARVDLHIVGVNEQQLKTVCDVSEASLEQLSGVLTAHGRVPHDEAIRYVREADYTLLFRDASLRYAKAGFPTKIVESLSCGTPPICNLSSDLGMYLKDGENAHIARDHSPSSIRDALEKALNSTNEHRMEMRKTARKTAEDCFDYHQYVEIIKELIK